MTGHAEAHSELLRATIVNCFPDHNKGSAALAAGLVTRLRASGVVGDISVIALAERVGREDFRHLRKAHPDVRILRSPLPDAHSLQTRRRSHKAVETLTISARRLGTRAAVVMARRHPDPALDALLTSDVVLERGGPFFKGMGPPPNPSLLRYTWPLDFARAAHVPYALVGESFGPLTNPWARRVVRDLVAGAGLVATREDVSHRVLADAGVPLGRATTMLDNAFWTEPRSSEIVRRALEVHGLTPGRFLAITCRDRRNRADEDHYLRQMARAIETLVPESFEAVAVVPNLFDPAGPEHDDRRIGRRLAEILDDPRILRLVEVDFAPDEVAAFYGHAALVIGHRLHSLILATAAGTPVVGIASSVGPKTTGVMRLLGMHDFVIPIEELTGDLVAARARRAIHDQTGVSLRIAALRQRSDQGLQTYLEMVDRMRRIGHARFAPVSPSITPTTYSRAHEPERREVGDGTQQH